MKVLTQPREAAAEPRPLFEFHPGRSSLKPNPFAVLGSLCLHACVITLLLVLATLSYPPLVDTHQVIMIPLHSEKLIWYSPKDRLPAVASDQQPKEGKPKVEITRPGQVITADAPKPVPARQLILQQAPKLSVEHETPSPNLLAFTRIARPEPKPFVPQQTPKVEHPLKALPEANPLAVAPPTSLPLPLATAIPGPAKPRPREFVPSAAAQPNAQPTVILETAPSLPATAAQQPSVVVVGLDPVRANEITVPAGSRAARFSAGPDSGAGGGEKTAAIVVPGLNVHGNASNAGVTVVQPPVKAPQTYHEPTAAEWTRAASGKDSRHAARSVMSVALRPGARVIAPFVETRFPDRPVYTTSFEIGADGSMEWVVWFVEQTVRNGQYLTIRPPLPWNSTEVASQPSLPPGRFEIAAVIDKDGQPSSVTVLKGGSQETNEVVAKLITDWSFLPALRNGEPIAVNTLIELSSRHKP